ncbi:MAG TPA: aldehyde dehydrogenase family protein, partial [Dongiaceae bacterium]|nr:aldehyde dehydrogenase family protein [Dongiaceae bacterium]
MTSPERIGNYIGGAWVEPRGASLAIENPSTGATLGEVPLSTAADVDRAVAAAKAAYPGWAATPVDKRVAPLFRLAALMRERREALTRTLVEENGKSLPDGRAEIDRTLENLETACGMPIMAQGEILVGAAPGIDGQVLRLPIGVFAMIAPFNFPAMVPFWFLPYAVAAGNTFVVKPSELVPRTMRTIMGWLAECGLPPGVVNLVNGDRAVSAALIAHPDVAGVSVVGRSATCQAIASACVAA